MRLGLLARIRLGAFSDLKLFMLLRDHRWHPRYLPLLSQDPREHRDG